VARIQLLPDSASYARRAGEILREHGVTEEELRTYVEVHGQDDDRMSRAYARVSARLDTLFPIAQPGAPATAESGSEPPPAETPGGVDSAPATP
jgi:hypothetical protein